MWVCGFQCIYIRINGYSCIIRLLCGANLAMKRIPSLHTLRSAHYAREVRFEGKKGSEGEEGNSKCGYV